MKSLSFKDHCTALRELLTKSSDGLSSQFDEAVEATSSVLESGSKVLACGNGGSSSDASHFVAEFVGRYLRERRALPAISLSAENASVTAIGNDYGYDKIFERQIEALGKSGDIIFGLSTSGKSENVIKGLSKAKEIGLTTVALTGQVGLSGFDADIVFAVPSSRTFEIQEVHKVILHSLCDVVEERLAK